MHAGTIIWNSTDLSLLGKPRLTISRMPDPPSPAMPTRMLVDLQVTIELEAQDPGTTNARAAELLNLMNATEGILTQSSGTGNAGSWLAIPGDNNISEALAGRTNSVKLSFSAVEPYSNFGSLHSASFQPQGTTTTIALHALRNWREEVKTSRHSERSAATSFTTTTYSFTARVAMANPSEPLTTRRLYLQAQANFIRGMNVAEGTLMTESINKIVRVTDFTPVIDERGGTLDVTVQCYAITLPDSATAECLIETDTGVDEGTGEETISIKGEISAETKDIAIAKLNLLRTAQLAIAGQRVISWRSQEKQIDGKDTALAVPLHAARKWTGALNFSMEIRKTRSGAHKTLRITSRKDTRSGWKWTYSGSVRASTEAASLSAARAIITGLTHALLTSSQETIEQVSDIQTPDTMNFIKVDFTYEFEGPADGFIGGEITSELSSPMAGEWRMNISGYLVAINKETALAKLTTLLTGNVNPLDQSDKWSEAIEEVTTPATTAKRVFTKLDFSRSYRKERTWASVEYTDTTQTSIPQMRQTRSVVGTVWTDALANADTALNAFLEGIFPAPGPHELTKGKAMLQFGKSALPASLAITPGGGEQFIKMDFSASKTVPLTGVTGYDLLEASLVMERTGALNATVITNIPQGRPVAQTGTGWLPGSITIQASAKAINVATARKWVQDRRKLVDTIGVAGVTRHETTQPRESETPEYIPLNVGDPSSTTFSGNYGWTFTGDVLDGLWGTSVEEEA